MEVIKDTCCGTCENCGNELVDLTIIDFGETTIDLCENCAEELKRRL